MAINKPAGLPVRRMDDASHSLMEAMPDLAEALGVEELHFVKAPERCVGSALNPLLPLCDKQSSSQVLFRSYPAVHHPQGRRPPKVLPPQLHR